jgi:hypothetical protein
VHSYVDACGCAGGPQTSIWYRFNGRRFVPTTPPGAAPKCTAFPLNHAAVLPGTPRYLGPPRWRFAPFHAARFACADGWALAVDSKRRFALFNQQAGRWHRASVGSLAFIGRDDEPFYALPTDLLRFLERRASRPSATSAPAHSGFGKG